jgi:hypothetical protein
VYMWHIEVGDRLEKPPLRPPNPVIWSRTHVPARFAYR